MDIAMPMLSSGLTLLVPIFGVIFIFGGPVLVIWLLINRHYTHKKWLVEQQGINIARALEAGKDVPLGVITTNPEELVVGNNNLVAGIKNIGLGIGLFIFLSLFLGLGLGSVGAVLVGIGVSQLALWRFVDRPNSLVQQVSRESKQG